VHGVTTTPIPLDTPEDRLAAAGEYVLGSLDAADRAAFEAAMARDATLQALVYGWQDRLMALSLHADPVAPSAGFWKRLESRLAPPAASAKAHQGPAPRSARSIPRPPWWHRMAVWQGISAVALAASLLLGVALALRMTMPDTPHVRYLAVLQSPDDQRSSGWIVEIDPAMNQARLVPVAATEPVPAGRALQFWTKAQGAAAPTSLGLVRAGQTVELPLSRLPAVGEQQLFELTLEPESGSPTGRPTGPILYVGRTVRI
jgi:anti-sigma-K factor RskA